MEAIKYLFTPIVLFSVWGAGWFFAGETLVPSPLSVFGRMLSIFSDSGSLTTITITVFRGVISLLLTYSIAIPAGILCGLNRNIMDGISPLVTLSQSCPPVLWIALLMIWSGTGTIVPVAVAVITILPVVFFSTAAAVNSTDSELYDIAGVYRVSKFSVLSDIILPSILPSLAGSLSYSLGVVWKVIATAEFFGSPDGIGSALYWSFRLLDITGIMAWALIIIIAGYIIDRLIIRFITEKFISINAGRK